ncbi:MAG: S53 family peptidase [Planctomycetes bacterium]|nr:S53 family peptidase [Planctomycetota bacterium]
MLQRAGFAFALTLIFAAPPSPLKAQEQGRPEILVPDSTLEDASDVGHRAHTNHRVVARPEGGLGPKGGMTPAQLRSFYGLASSGGQGVIAIVDAYDYPNALRDFNVFSTMFGLPTEPSTSAALSTNAVFQVIFQGKRKPRSNTGWSQEAALDVQWAHAMAPSAKILLVEAQSNSFGDLLAAVDLAKTYPGVQQVSMSWGGSEFSSEANYDYHFNVDGPAFFASSGDAGGKTCYPSVSPYVVAAGGTSVATDATGAFVGESGWSGGGGGLSAYEAAPGWQGALAGIAGGKRCVPDIASDADPYTGVAVYAPLQNGSSTWQVFGGTSVSAPCLAGMMNLSGKTYANTSLLLAAIYAGLGSANFRDITTGGNGFPCTAGWDFVTGVGAPQGTGGF